MDTVHLLALIVKHPVTTLLIGSLVRFRYTGKKVGIHAFVLLEGYGEWEETLLSDDPEVASPILDDEEGNRLVIHDIYNTSQLGMIIISHLLMILSS